MCPNPFCGKVFTIPLRTENLSSSSTETYNACPYCLTETSAEKVLQRTNEIRQELEKPKIAEVSLAPDELKQAESSSKVQGCTRQFGYLSKRSSKEKIPDECITCEKIVQCMLKAVIG